MMSLDLLKQLRVWAFAVAMAAGTAGVTGCAADQDNPFGVSEYLENDGTAVDEVTDVSHTAIRRQSIGNCWIYATVAWVESMQLRYSGTETNYSESYLTYWDWYSKITSGELSATNEVETGGHWGTAADLIRTRGLMVEADFLPEEATLEMSIAQKNALATINESLKTGALSTAAARNNRALVRDELDRAFGLRTEVVAELDRVFGTDGARTLANTSARRDFIKRPTEIYVGSTRTSSGNRRRLSLSDVTGTSRSLWNPDQRNGTYAWRGVALPTDSTGRKDVLRRVLRALNDGHPVVINWLVDFNGLDNSGNFTMTQLRSASGPGRQGGHLSVLEDYVVDNVPGYGTLGLGQLPAEQRTAALDGTLRLFRIKNSWGQGRSDRASYAGYYDLYLDYLLGPINWKTSEAVNASTTARTPLSSFILPPGY